MKVGIAISLRHVVGLQEPPRNTVNRYKSVHLIKLLLIMSYINEINLSLQRTVYKVSNIEIIKAEKSETLMKLHFYKSSFQDAKNYSKKNMKNSC